MHPLAIIFGLGGLIFGQIVGKRHDEEHVANPVVKQKIEKPTENPPDDNAE